MWYFTGAAGTTYVYPDLPAGVTVYGDPPTRIECEGVTDSVIDFNNLEVNGGGLQMPLRVDTCSNLEIQKLLVHDSDDHVVLIVDSDTITLEEVLAYNAPSDENKKVFQGLRSDNLVFRHCAGWGTGRKIFEMYACDDAVIDRCYARWERSTQTSPKGAFAPAYNSLRATVTDCVGEMLNLPPAEALTQYYIFIADNTWDIGSVPSEAEVIRCLALSEFNSLGSFVVGATCQITYTDCVDASQAGRATMDRSKIWTLRDLWRNSPILSRVIAAGGPNILARLDSVLKQKSKPSRGRGQL